MSVFKGELQMRIDDSQDLSSFGISFNSICAIKLRSLLFDVCFIYMPPKNVRSAHHVFVSSITDLSAFLIISIVLNWILSG